MGERCEFVLDPNDETTWTGSKKGCQLEEEDYNQKRNGESIWHCPRRSIVGMQYCPFHVNSAHKSISTELAFLHTINGNMYTQLPLEDRFNFFGSKFCNFYIHTGQISTPEETTIKLSHCEFWTRSKFENISSDTNMIFDGSYFSDKVVLDSVAWPTLSFKECFFWEGFDTDSVCSFNSLAFQRAEFRKEADFSAIFTERLIFLGARFREEANFIGSNVDSLLFFTGAKFEMQAYFTHINTSFAIFDECVFQDATFFNKATFNDRANFSSCLFGKVSSFKQSEFKSSVDFSDSSLFKSVFSNATFKGAADFTVTVAEEIQNPEDASIFNDTCIFDGSHFKGEVDFRISVGEDGNHSRSLPTFRSSASFKNITLDEGGEFDGASRESDTECMIDFSSSEMSCSSFRDSSLDGCRFVDANLTDSNLAGASLVATNLQRTNLTRVNLFNANLYAAKLYSAILSDIQIDENTAFGGHYIQTLDDIKEENESNIRKSIWCFRTVERISYANSLSRQGRSAYISRKDIKRKLEKKRGNRSN